ncbi:hypothetical protein [Psychroserpens damuponensis]|uniref:hypothetical protein n=1 Tax=Psychroserpens damuponensis TaxID=943936 RepID=UPI00058AFF5A|nr:hypothetical protein [Psychroserpens damuponensis]
MGNVQILETAKAKKAKGIDLNDKETELYNNYLNVMQAHPNTYKNDAYGVLSELYDNLKSFDPEQTDKDNQTSIYFEIDSTINDAILFAKTTELKPEKVNKIIKKSKFLNEVKAKLNKVNKADINEIENAFDFDLDGNDTPKKFIEHAELIEAKILKGIEADEAGKVANENGLKPIPENAIHIFKKIETYNQFIEFTEKHIIEPYLDYSYLFQRLKYEELIHHTSHSDFMKWLLSTEFITEKNYDNFDSKGCFYALSKCTNSNRENNFNNIFKLN